MHFWYQLKASSTSDVHVLTYSFLLIIVASSILKTLYIVFIVKYDFPLLKLYLVSVKGLVKTGIDFMLIFQQTLCLQSATIHRSINLNSAK